MSADISWPGIQHEGAIRYTRAFEIWVHLYRGGKIFGNGLPWLNSSTSLQMSIKTLSADRKLRDQYQVCDLYTNTAI